MTDYEYTSITSINLTSIYLGVQESSMSDKSLEDCNWDEGTEILTVTFTNSLSAPDKTILDGIVADSAMINDDGGNAFGDDCLLVVKNDNNLKTRYNAGNVKIGTTIYNITTDTLDMADDDTNYVFINSSGTPASNTTGFPSDSIPLAEVVTASGAISGITDKRSFLLAAGPWLKVESGNGLNVAANTLIETTYTLIANRIYLLIATITADAGGVPSYAINSVIAGTNYDQQYVNNSGVWVAANNQAKGVMGNLSAGDTQTFEISLEAYDATISNMATIAKGVDDGNGYKYRFGSFSVFSPVTVIGFTSSGQFDHSWTLYELQP